MDKKEVALETYCRLERLYPNVKCSLEYTQPYELLFAVILSAQCTDARVNLVTHTLFKKYPTLEDYANCDILELEQDIKPCGFFRNKAKNIRATANVLLSDFNGQLPNSMEGLLTLSGVGRKTANLIMGDVYHQPAIVTDTHCIRIANRLGLTDSKKPPKVERDLVPLIPKEGSADFCHRLVQFGRDVCKARNPMCDLCPLNDICVGKVIKL
jgi:endonuclease-3